MSDEQEIPAWPEGANVINAQYAWTPKPAKDERPPVFASDDALYKPVITQPDRCEHCGGHRWLVKRSDDISQSSELVRCSYCAAVPMQASNERIAECWRISNLVSETPEALTFQTFLPHDAASKAMRTAAILFAEQRRGWLTMYGTWGGGKSHLGEAITRNLLEQRIPCVYMRAPDLMAYLGAVDRQPGANVDYDGRMYWVQRTAVLVVDEFAKETRTDAVMKLRTALFDYRYQQARANEGGATVILTNSPLVDWPDQAIASRAEDGRFTLLECSPLDYRKVKRV